MDNIKALKGDANRIRRVIKEVETDVLTFKACVGSSSNAAAARARAGTSEVADAIDFGEAIANVMLAFRHLEDARMRLGKCIQALDGGVSIYDRDPPQQQQ